VEAALQVLKQILAVQVLREAVGQPLALQVLDQVQQEVVEPLQKTIPLRTIVNLKMPGQKKLVVQPDRLINVSAQTQSFHRVN